MRGDVAIRVEGLTKRFGEPTALGGIGFEGPQATLFGRDAAATRRRGRARRRATDPVPGRAHHRPRPVEPERAVADDPRARRGWDDGAAHNPVPRGGRSPRGPDRRRRPRPRGGQRHAGKPEGGAREHGRRDGARGRAGGDPRGGSRCLGRVRRARGARGRDPPTDLERRLAGARGAPPHPRRRGPGAGHAHGARAEHRRRVPPADRAPSRVAGALRGERERWPRAGWSPMIAVERSVELARERRARWTPFSPVRDAIGAASRNLIAYRRGPPTPLLFPSQPGVFRLMFRYVFGGAIQLPGSIPYVDFLMPGIFVQTAV